VFQRLNHRGGHYLLLGTVSAALFLVNLGGPSLWDLDEGRNSACAQAMLETGDWVVPTFNAQLRDDKPVLLYWLQVCAYLCLGVTEGAARLPSALAALATVLLTYELGRRLFGAATGLLAGLVLASTALFCASAHFANPDALLNACTVLTMLLFWQGYAAGRLRFGMLGAATGLGALAKGPVGLVLPCAAGFVFLLWERRLRLLWDRRLLRGLLTFALVALPWYLLVTVETKGAFTRGFLLKHNVQRAVHPLENHSGPVFYHVASLAVGFAPWSVFLGLAGWYGLRRQARDDAEPRGDGLPSSYRLLWCWIAVYLVAFSVAATKLPGYTLPVYAPVALLTARFLDRWRCGTIQPPAWAVHLSLGCLVLVGLVTASGLVLASGVVPAAFLRGRSFPGLEAWAVVGLLPVAGAAGAWWCGRRRRLTGLLVCVSAAAVLFVGTLAAFGSSVFNKFKAPRQLVEQAEGLVRTRDLLIGAYQLEHLPSLTFYCQRTVAHQPTAADALCFLRSPTPVYLFLPAPTWDAIAGQARGPYRVLGRSRDLYRGGDVVVVTNE
jgi:4-amino-4-deoxy-L-arabinose transferase-like glycosyltransferase